jgi:hypothetical protein
LKEQLLPMQRHVLSHMQSPLSDKARQLGKSSMPRFACLVEGIKFLYLYIRIPPNAKIKNAQRLTTGLKLSKLHVVINFIIFVPGNVSGNFIHL